MITLKKIISLSIISLILLSCNKKDDDIVKENQIYYETNLTLWSVNNSLNSKMWEQAITIFEKQNRCKITLIKFQNCFSLYDSLKSLEQNSKNRKVDVVTGLSNQLMVNAQYDSLFLHHKPINYHKVKNRFKYGLDCYTIPYGYNYLVFFYNKDNLEYIPKSFGQLQDSFFKGRLLLFNPESTALGNNFIIWSFSAFEISGYRHFWRGIKENIYSIEKDYKQACSMFKNETVSLMLGYLCNPFIKSKNNYFCPQEGSFMQIYSAAISRYSENKQTAELFLEFLLSKEFQSLLTKEKPMYPIEYKIEQIAKYNKISENDLTKKISKEIINKYTPLWLKNWNRIIK